MLMFNELTVSLYLYILIMLTDFNDSVEAFEILAIILLGVIIVALIVNLLAVAFNFLSSLVKGVKKLRLMIRNYKASSGQKYFEYNPSNTHITLKEKKAPIGTFQGVGQSQRGVTTTEHSKFHS